MVTKKRHGKLGGKGKSEEKGKVRKKIVEVKNSATSYCRPAREKK
jgi:hypothetical protein